MRTIDPITPSLIDAPKPKLWLTYSWEDPQQQVDFIVQELESLGIEVIRDKTPTTLRAGIPLWPQIDAKISGKDETDAWAIYLTANSLNSKPCLEELNYALARAIGSLGADYPLIGITNGEVGSAALPKAISTRLYVHLNDPQWAQKISDSLRGIQRAPVPRPSIAPFEVSSKRCDPQIYNRPHVIRIRPRAGVWAPYFIGVRTEVKEHINPYVAHGSGDIPPQACIQIGSVNQPSLCGGWWIMGSQDAISWTTSAWLFCDHRPTELTFGVMQDGSKENYHCRNLRFVPNAS